VIDALAFFGHYPFRRLSPRSLAGVAHYLGSKSFSRIYAACFSSIFYRDPLEGNREALEEFSASRDRIPRGVEVRILGGFNPTYIGPRKELVEKALERGFAAYLVAPAYHGFKIDSKEVLRFLEIAHELGVRVVFLDLLEDPREAHRGYILRYAVKRESFKRFISKLDRSFSREIMLASFRYDLLRENLDRLADLELYIDVSSDSFYGPQYDRLKEVVEAVGEDLVVASTRAPLAYPEASIYRVIYSNINDSSKDRILSRNPLEFYEKAL